MTRTAAHHDSRDRRSGHTNKYTGTLPQLDPSYTDHVAVIADHVDGAPFKDAGPYPKIVPFEKRQARWVRNMTSVDVQNVSAP